MSAPRDKSEPWLALRHLGYPSYKAYLRSQYWVRFRTEYYRRYGKRCQANMCDEQAAHLHHATYERLGAERFSDVLAVCEWHHTMIHRKAGGVSDLEKLREVTVWCCGNLSRSKNTLAKVQRAPLR